MSCSFCGMPPLDGEPCCTDAFRRDTMRRADMKIKAQALVIGERDAELHALRARVAELERAITSDLADRLGRAIELPEREALQKRVAELETPMTWKTIDTAPRDGTAILVHDNNAPGLPGGRTTECNSHNTYVAAWWAGENHGQGAWICYMDAILDPECPIEPTHWMPLPEVPRP